MSTLGDIDEICKNIAKAPVRSMKLLHNLIFPSIPDDRKNRKRLRDFTGFTFKFDSKEYSDKIKFINETFFDENLETTCEILCLNNDDRDKAINLICHYLSNLDELEKKVDEEEFEDAEEEEEELKPRQSRCRRKKPNTDLENLAENFRSRNRTAHRC